MKKFISALSLASYLTLAPAALAIPINLCPGGQFNPLCEFTSGSISGIIGTLIQLVFAIAVIVDLFYLIWGGFKWVTSEGDKGAIMQARAHIVAAIVGLIIIFASYFILNIVLGFFDVGSLNRINVPL